jgi:heat shock protein HslJ
MKKVLFAVAAMVMFAACCGEGNLPMENTKWNLTELQGAANDVFADADTFWFSLDGESIVGVGACNRFFGGYKMTQSGSFEVGAMGMTRMACPDMELEDAFVHIIDEADSYEIKGNVMILKKGAEILAQFSGEAVTPAPNDTDVE